MDPTDFMARCQSLGVDEDTLKRYSSGLIGPDDRLERGELAERVLQDMFATPYVEMVKRKGSCHFLFNPIVYRPMVRFRLKSEFIMNRVLVNKFKLVHPVKYSAILRAYNERLYVR